MPRLLIFVGLIFPALPAIAQGTLSPTNPLVNQGGSTTITCTANCGTGGTFSCTTCSGTLSGATSTSVIYTAPVTITPQQSAGGYQLLPNDHIFNKDIFSLPAASNSATVMMNVGSATLSYLDAFPLNYTNGTTPTEAQTFINSPNNNAVFQTPLWPTAGIENGWFDALMNNNADHHILTIDTTNGNLGERYQTFGQAPLTSCTVNASNSATCTLTPTKTSSGFIRAAAVGQKVCVGGFSGADTYLNICPSGSMAPAVLTAATATSITFNLTHAAASTTTTGQATLSAPGAGSTVACAVAGLCNSSGGVKYTYADYPLPTNENGTADAAGLLMEPLILKSQEFVSAVVNGGSINHAMRMTLSNGFICGSNVANSCVIGSVGNATGTRHIWPATSEAFSGGGTIPYGARFRLKSSFNISTFSAAAQILLTCFQHYGLILADGGTNWQIDPDFDNMPATEVNALNEVQNAHIATSNWEAVDVSSLMESSASGAVNTGEYLCYTSSTGTVCTNINLQAPTVNVGTNQYYIMAGTPAQQLTVYSNGAYTCSMSPSVGTLSSGCVYTPPTTAGSVTTTTVTVTSTANSSVKAQTLIYVLPNAGIRIIQCSGVADGCSAQGTYTDSFGNVWYGSGSFGTGMANIPNLQGCCQHDASFANITDKQLWWNKLGSSLTTQDYKIDMHVPAGIYEVTYRLGPQVASGADILAFYVNGTLIGQYDPTAISGGVHQPFSLVVRNVVVGNSNLLSFYIAGIGGQAAENGDISSISIIPGAVAHPAGSLP